MAAQWGAGEATRTACNMDFFTIDTLEQTAGNTLGALQSCLDPSILSLFEDSPALESKGLDEESEATLLTALTEILDNTDDENLSPFDTLPDSDLISGRKGREHSPLRRSLCVSRSPAEKQALCGVRPHFTGKSIPKTQDNALQRSDGEEEEDGYLSLSPAARDSFPDSESLDWAGLTLPLPIAFEQEGDDGLSVSLGELVRHMHSYCMTVHVEDENGKQVLPEGGIVLEVVDKGENGEPILAIPDLNGPRVEDDHLSDDSNDTSEHIIVDDDDDVLFGKTAADNNTRVTPSQCQDLKDEMKRQKALRGRSPAQRKRKKKCKRSTQCDPGEHRVLRSTKKMALKSSEATKIVPIKDKNKVTKSTEALAVQVKSKNEAHCPSVAPAEKTTTQFPAINQQSSTLQLPKQGTTRSTNVDTNPTSVAVCSQKPAEPAKPTVQMKSSAVPVSSSTLVPKDPPGALDVVSTQTTPLENATPPPPASTIAEAKPKPLSLEQYRLLRQQKKPAPLEKQVAPSTKWPSLPELPKELLPIPCLPSPVPRDPRHGRFNPQATKDTDEVMTAWQPRGPGAPPTPEALLAPPAYMVTTSSRVPAVRQSQRSLSNLPPSAPEPQSTTVKNSDATLHTTTQASAPPAGCLESCSGPASSADVPLSAGPSEDKPQPESTPSTKSSTPSAVCSPQNSPDVPLKAPKASTAVDSTPANVAHDGKSLKPNSVSTVFTSTAQLVSQKSDGRARKKPAVVLRLHKAKSPTQELIESFTSEIGIEAADLTSLLEQFEETQAKVEQCVPEVSGRAAAVGNSSVQIAPEKTVVERLRAPGLTSSAALTPPATPPQQLWKPVPLIKSKAVETSKSHISKVIPIEARPLPSSRFRNKAAPPPPVDPSIACRDHDYCLSYRSTELSQCWNVKRQSSITIKPIKQQTETTTGNPAACPMSLPQSIKHPTVPHKTQVVPPMEGLEHRTDEIVKRPFLETPDSSPSYQENQSPQGSVQTGSGKSDHRPASSPSHAASSTLRIKARGRSRKRPRRSPSTASSCSNSDSCSSRSRSRSSSPKNKRYRSRRSQSSSSSSSRSSSRSRHSLSPSPPRRRRYSYSSSRSGSWSCSRSRSRSPQKAAKWKRSRGLYSPTYRSYNGQNKKPGFEEAKRRKEKAIEERRIVYVGRIRGSMTQKELGERFSFFGEIEECTLHFRDHGDNYGFVTYYNTKDAFTAIENGTKLRKPDELPFDLCFGGRRQFCQTSYADLDSNREYDPFTAKGKFHTLDFDTLLKQAQQNLKR